MTRILTFALSFVLSINLFAQVPDNSTPILTGSDVERFIKHFPAIQKEFDEADYDFDTDNDLETILDGFEGYSEVNSVVQKYGYKDYSEFAVQTWAIAACYASIKMETEGMPNIQQAIDEIDANENLTSEQKEMSKQQLTQVYAALGSSITSMANEQDVELIKKYVDRLEVIFNED